MASYSSRPILHVKSGLGPGASSRAYTVIDEVIRFGEAPRRADLKDAYKKAGTAFRGQLEQHFVVLRDQEFVNRGMGPKRGKRDRDEEGETSGNASKSKKLSLDSDY